MLTRSIIASLTLCLAACGGDGSTDDTGAEMSVDDFRDAFETAYCDQLEACSGTPCDGSEMLITDPDGCDYDGSQASACLDGIDCSAQTGDGLEVFVPLACDEAYACAG
jgi:hypothetical protein